MWGLKDWVGSLYRRRTRAADYLAEYGSVFNTVEGNTTFYSLPTPASVERWRDAVPESFRFAFKLPREVTHRRRLEGAAGPTRELLARLAPLGQRLGPFMIQLPPSFGPRRLAVLDDFLAGWTQDFRFAVEVRHPAFYGDRGAARSLDETLARHGGERILMDTRPLRSGAPELPAVARAVERKPDLPIEPVALGQRPMLRLVCHPDDAVNEPWFELWRDVLALWIREGRTPYVFVHCADDAHAPRFARRLLEVLSGVVDVGTMPAWPGERPEPESGQLSLLDL